MANWVITKDFLAPSQVIAASEDGGGGFYAANVLQARYPFRPWRSVGTTSKALVFDFGAAVTVAAIIENNANHTTVLWEAGTGVSTFPDSLGSRTIPANDQVGDRLMGLIPVTMGTPRRYLRRTPSGLLSGETAYELGSVLFVTVAGMTPLLYNVGFPTYSQVQAVEVVGIGSQANVQGPETLEAQLGQPQWRRGTADAHLHAMRRLFSALVHTPHLLYENTGQDGDGVSPYAYYVQAVGPVQHTLTKVTLGAQLTVREVIA